MRGLEKYYMKRGHQTNTQTITHHDSMKASAQIADALKRNIEKKKSFEEENRKVK